MEPRSGDFRPSIRLLLRFPDLPGRVAALDHVVERLLLLEGVHRHPEAVVPVGIEAVLLHQPGEALHHELLAFEEIVEDLRAQDEIAAVHQRARLLQAHHALDLATLAQLDEVEGIGRRDGAEAADRVRGAELLHHVVEVEVGQDVGVVRQEHLLVLQVLAHPEQPAADVGGLAGVDEGNSPVANVRLEQIEGRAAVLEHEVVAHRRVVLEEEALDRLALVAEAENEVLVPEGGVVGHHVPEDRQIAHRNQGLRDLVGILPQPGALSPAEYNYLHVKVPSTRSYCAPTTPAGSIDASKRKSTGRASLASGSAWPVS